MANNMSTVVGVFLDQDWAQRAIQALQAAGFKARVADKGTVGQLSNMGIERNAASLYESRLNEGGSVVVVDEAGNRGEDALGIMLQNGAENIDMSKNAGGQAASTSGTADTDHYQRLQNVDQSQRQYGHVDQNAGRAKTADELRVQLREETLTPVKQATQAGEVQVQKVVHEKQEQVPVNLRHEEVVIERHAVDRPVNPNEVDDMTDQVISVPVYEERAELQKQARVTEEVTVGKRAQEEQQTLTGTTRHEHLEVNQTGNVQVTGNTGTTGQGQATGHARTTQQWSEVMPTYQQHWQQSHGTSGGSWEEAEPGYRYGYEMRNDPRYQGRSYNEVESDLRQGWGQSQGGAKTGWDKVSANVREAWNDMKH